MGMDDNFTRISLSTAELEANDGDIMFDKVHAKALLAASTVIECLAALALCIGRLVMMHLSMQRRYCWDIDLEKTVIAIAGNHAQSMLCIRWPFAARLSSVKRWKADAGRSLRICLLNH